MSSAAARSGDETIGSVPALVLRGRPTRLAASASVPVTVLAAARETHAMPAVELHVHGAVAESVRLRRPRETGGPSRLRVRLSASTPPGRYEGSAVMGDTSLPLVIDVEAAPRLRSTPTRYDLTGEPKGSASIDVELANTGNVPIEVPARSSFCLFDGGGIDHAVWAALTSDPPAGKGRLDVLLDDLAVSHGGLVDVRVRDGAGAIAPGERRTCRIELGWSDRLRPGRVYAGSWEVAGLRLPIRVETPRPTSPPDKPTRPGTAASTRRAR